MKTRARMIHMGLWVLILGLALLYGCSPNSSGSSKHAGTETGNPVQVASVMHVSAEPPVFEDDKLPEAFFSAVLPMEGEQGSPVSQQFFVSPKITWPMENGLLIAGADRGIQLLDLPVDRQDPLRGSALLPGIYSDVSVVNNRAYLLTRNTLHQVSFEDRKAPLLEKSLPLDGEVLRLSLYGSDLVRVSVQKNGYTLLDVVPAGSIQPDVAQGLILPLEVESERLYGNAAWLKGRHIENGTSYLLGVDLDQLKGVTELLDLSDMITADPASLQIADGTPVFAVKQVATTSLSQEAFDHNYFTRIIQLYGLDVLRMFYGTWMDNSTFIVVSDKALHIYDLTDNDSTSSVRVPIDFRPESFWASGSTLVFSYFRKASSAQGGNATKNLVNFFYKAFDLTDPSNPMQSSEVTCPGTLLSLRGNRLLTLEFLWDFNDHLNEYLTASTVEDGQVSVKAWYQLPGRTISRFVHGDSVIAILAGDAPEWLNQMHIVDFSETFQDPSLRPVVLYEACDEASEADASCGVGVCASPNNIPSQCKDGVFTPCQPGLPEEHNETNCFDGLDNDCDGSTDGEDPDCRCTDRDSDGYGNPGSVLCPNGAHTDCNDQNRYQNPGRIDICDGIDNNCNGIVDEDFPQLHPDRDGDGYGDSSSSIESCDRPPLKIQGVNYVADNQDCDDSDAWVHPNADEILANDVDDNCNGATDEEDSGSPELNVGLEANRSYVLQILPTPQRLQGTYVVAQPVDSMTGDLNTSLTFNALPGVSSNVAIDNGLTLQEPAGFGSSVDGDKYVGTLRFTTNHSGTGFVGTTGTSKDFQFDTIFNTPKGDFSQEYRPRDATQNSYMRLPSRMAELSGTVGPDGSMTLIMDGRIAGMSANPGLAGARWNVESNEQQAYFSTGFVANSLGAVHGARIRKNQEDGQLWVTLVSAGMTGRDWQTFGFTPYVEVWKGIITLDQTTPAVRNASLTDDDRDGYSEVDGDCNDSNPNINPSVAENPSDGIDNDCNPLTPDHDMDGDGFAAGFDCDDTRKGINPNALEIPGNSIDENCNGLIDEPLIALADGNYVLIIDADQENSKPEDSNNLKTYFDFQDSKSTARPGTNGVPSGSAGVIYFTVQSMPSSSEMDVLVAATAPNNNTAMDLKEKLKAYSITESKLITIDGQPRDGQAGVYTYPGGYRLAEFNSSAGGYTHYIPRRQLGAYETATGKLEFFLEAGMADTRYGGSELPFPYNPMGTEGYFNESRSGALLPNEIMVNKIFRGSRVVFRGTMTIDLNEDGIPDDPDEDSNPDQPFWSVRLATGSNIPGTNESFAFMPYGHVLDGVIVYLGN